MTSPTPTPTRRLKVAQNLIPAAGMTACSRCQGVWGGLKAAHCTADGCHQTFTTVSAFDKHRTGSHPHDTRTCLPPEQVGLVDAGRTYPCWGFPGRDETDA